MFSQVNELLHEADVDGDGCINYLEFVKIMTQDSLQMPKTSNITDPNQTINEDYSARRQKT